jgi:hypothetical protein
LRNDLPLALASETTHPTPTNESNAKKSLKSALSHPTGRYLLLVLILRTLTNEVALGRAKSDVESNYRRQ